MKGKKIRNTTALAFLALLSLAYCSGTSFETLANANKKSAAQSPGAGGSAPTLENAILYDCDADGNIDQVVLRFSAPIKDTSFTDADAARFKLGTTAFLSVDTTTGGSGAASCSKSAACSGGNCPAYSDKDPGVANDAYVTLFTNDITEKGTEKKAISYTKSSGRVSDAQGAELASLAYTAGASLISDKALPVILKATTETGGAALAIHFSEPVFTVVSACTSGTVTHAAFAYTNTSASGVSSLTATAESNAADSLITVTANTNFIAADIFTDTVSVAAGTTLCDASQNTMAAAAVTVTGVIRPYLLSVVSLTAGSVRATFSEDVDSSSAASATSATNTANYCIDTDGTTQDGSFAANCGNSLGALTITKISGSVYDIATAVNQTAAVTYYFTVKGISDTNGVIDVNEARGMSAPYYGTFVGQETLKVVAAEATSLNSFLITFSKNVLGGTAAGGAGNTSYYSLTSSLGNVSSAERYDGITGLTSDASKVLVTHSGNQAVGIYSVTVSTALVNAAATENLQGNPYDRTSFAGFGGNVLTLDDGALFTDPFGDGTSFAFAFNYKNKIYLGPNNNNTGVFRFDPDGANAATVTFANASATNNGTPTFGTNMTRPGTNVSLPGTPTATTTRYNFPTGTDLSAFAAGSTLAATGCANANNNKSTVLTAVSAAGYYVEVDDAAVGTASAAETCSVLIYRGNGPAGFSGVDSFNAATVGDIEYLVFGGHKEGGGGFNEIHVTTDADVILNNSYCNISAATLGNTQSLQTIYAYGANLYTAFASSSASGKPFFANITLASLSGNGTSVACSGIGSAFNGTSGASSAKEIDYLGNSGGNGNSAANTGIDSIIVSAVSGTNLLYIANNGGIAVSSTLLPTAASNFEGNTATSDIIACDAIGGGICNTAWSSGGTTRQLPSINKLRPGERGIPFIVEFNNRLYIARNRQDNNTAELWKYDGTTFTKILDSATTNTNNNAISLVKINGTRLYIGFDNATNGVEIYYTASTNPAGAGNFTKLGSSGLGPVTASAAARAYNRQIISSASLQNAADGKYYLYITAGCTSSFADDGTCDRNPTSGAVDFSIKVFRQVD